jgi:hypothetical protein
MVYCCRFNGIDWKFVTLDGEWYIVVVLMALMANNKCRKLCLLFVKFLVYTDQI